MIESIHIENFQAHKALGINLEQVTTLVGPTDAGKSSITRFLRWVLLNESAGDITTWGQDGTRGLVMVDSRLIERRKNKKENCYQIGEQTPYDAVGKSVPPDVASLLNVGDVNFQGQLDPHFWLSETPGEVSRQLNAVVDLSAMDDLASAMASDVLGWTNQVRMNKTALDKAKAKRAELKWTEEANEEFRRVEWADAYAEQARNRIDSLAKAVQRGVDARLASSEALESAERGRERLLDATVWLQAQELVNLTQNRVDSLFKAIASLDVWALRKEECKVGAETMRRLAGDAGAWMEAVDALKKKADEYQRLAKIVVSVGMAQTVAQSARENAAQAAKLLSEAMGDNCPLCGASKEDSNGW